MNLLKFISYGNYSHELGNNSAYLKENNNLLLIDCGSTIFNSILEQGILDDINKIHILITHTHDDHIGSLSSLLLYLKYNHPTKIDYTIIVPEPIQKSVRKHLKRGGVTDDLFIIVKPLVGTYYIQDPNDESKTWISFKCKETRHVPELKCFSYCFKYKGHDYFYSGDTAELSVEDIERIQNLYYKMSYIDVTGNPNNPCHLPFNTLCNLLMPEVRQHVTCMHLDTLTKADIALAGFSTPIVTFGG